MAAQILDGKALAAKIRLKIKQDIALRKAQTGVTPGLAVIVVGSDPASHIYVAHKARACEDVGIASRIDKLDAEVSTEVVLALIHRHNQDPAIHGILLQVPLPSHIDLTTLIEAISPLKDVDGFHPYNLGKLMSRSPVLRPCTPYGIIQLINSVNINIQYKNAVVVGASNIVGRPMSLELLLAGATTTVCHRFTPEKELIEHIKKADILIAAVGKPHFIQGEWIKPQAVVIDVGITRMPDGGLCGDVDFESAKQEAAWITPVPGGVGPMTIACLLNNTWIAYC